MAESEKVILAESDKVILAESEKVLLELKELQTRLNKLQDDLHDSSRRQEEQHTVLLSAVKQLLPTVKEAKSQACTVCKRSDFLNREDFVDHELRCLQRKYPPGSPAVQRVTAPPPTNPTPSVATCPICHAKKTAFSSESAWQEHKLECLLDDYNTRTAPKYSSHCCGIQ